MAVKQAVSLNNFGLGLQWVSARLMQVKLTSPGQDRSAPGHDHTWRDDDDEYEYDCERVACCVLSE